MMELKEVLREMFYGVIKVALLSGLFMPLTIGCAAESGNLTKSSCIIFIGIFLFSVFALMISFKKNWLGL